jgi:hypothetical protein
VVVALVALVVGSLLEQGLALEQDSQGVGARPAWNQKCVRKEISRPVFLDVSRQGFRKLVALRRVFFMLLEYFDTHF